MKVNLYGGFGEKGRLAVGISAQTTKLLFDVGVKRGESGREYYPLIEAEDIAALDAVLISHAHEDHVGGLLWLLREGFHGCIFMTAETLAETERTLQHAAEKQDLENLALPEKQIELFKAGDELTCGAFKISTGRSGHVVGGVWFCAEFSGRKILYSGDVTPDNSVLEMDAFPQCDLLLLDTSYGADEVTAEERVQQIREWILLNRDGCLLPTSLFGRSLEIMALMPLGFAIHADMRAPLAEQIAVRAGMRDGIADKLKRLLDGAQDWRADQALPRCPLLTFDAMGRGEPSAYAMNRAVKTGWPVLLTEHVEPDTPALEMLGDELADWIRLPNHPTLSGVIALWEQADKPQLIGHSCSQYLLNELATHIPALKADAKSGDLIELV